MDRVLQFAGILLAGYATRLVLEQLLGRTHLYNRLVAILVKIVYYVLIPLAFMSIFLNRGLLAADSYILLYFLVFLGLAYLYACKRVESRSEYSLARFLLIGFPNSVFLGFPVVDALIGRIQVAAVFGVITVVLNVLVPDIIAKTQSSLKTLVSSTGFLGFIIGVFGHYLLGTYAYVIHWYTAWSSPLLSYLATFTMGMRIPVKFTYMKTLRRELFEIGVLRFMVAPIIAFTYATILGFSTIDRAELVIVSSMPPAVMNAIIAEKYGWGSQLVALIIALLTIVFLVFIFPVLIALKPLLL